jgi:hypothetical protein
MRTGVLSAVVGCASLLAACDPEGGDPVQHALRDAAAARQAAALRTTEEEQARAGTTDIRPAPTSASDEELSPLLAARRQAVEDTRALIAATTDPALKKALTDDLEAEEDRLRALEAHSTADQSAPR